MYVALGANETREENVSISLDYLVFLHDALRLNLSKNAEILGDTSSAALFNFATDHVRAKRKEKGNAPRDLDAVLTLMKSWGFRVVKKDTNEAVEVKVECPLAGKVHPRLSPSPSGCPLGELLLATVRDASPNALLSSNELTSTGAVVKIAKPSE